MSIQEKIRQQVTENDIILYMKGTPQFPQCGFSSKVVMLLKACDVKFTAVNVLEDAEIRQGIKDFSQWPTVPQLYVKGNFIGGSDIVSEMYAAGELQTLLKNSVMS
jgi:monothiol glutaredoxin